MAQDETEDLLRIPYFSTDSRKLDAIKKYVDYSAISQQQKWFIHLIYEENFSRQQVNEQWQKVFGCPICRDSMATCARRTAFSLWWRKGTLSSGSKDYLTPKDMETLEHEIQERAELHNALDTVSILDVAQNLKIERFNKAVEFLRLIRSDKAAEVLENTQIEKPTRTWTNNLLDKLNAHLTKPRLIDGKRFLAVSYQKINDYFNKFGAFIGSFDKLLIITADETMIQANSKPLKVIVPTTMPSYTSSKPPEMPHITAMCSNNLVGASPPLFIIIKNRKTLPQELKDLVYSGQIAVASTTTGWMDRWCFLIWCIHFVSWLTQYRSHLPLSLRGKNLLLIMDGHSSRENPIALEYLKLYGIEVLILPGHCTHVLQLFDVGLAAPLKDKFTNNLLRALKDPRMYVYNAMSENIRRIVVEAFMNAWASTCTATNVASAARITGIHPVNRNAPRETGFLKDLTPEEVARQARIDARKANSLDINCCIITSDEKIAEIRETVKKSKDDALLARSLNEFENADEFFSFYFNAARDHGVYALSVPPACAEYSFDKFFS